MLERIAVNAEADVRLVGSLRVHLDARMVLRIQLGGLGLSGLSFLQVTEQLVDPLVEIVADLPTDPDDHPRGLVPVTDIAVERLALRAADGLLATDDVPPERLIAVEELLVNAADEVAWRVVVHVHLLDDHALLALDLSRVERRVAQHVDEHVKRDVARLRRAFDVVAGVLLAGEGVELAADTVDLH